jgi:hypothetical protein
MGGCSCRDLAENREPSGRNFLTEIESHRQSILVTRAWSLQGMGNDNERFELEVVERRRPVGELGMRRRVQRQ